MKQMIFKSPERDYYADDIARMRADLNKLGMDASCACIRRAWEAFSQSMAVGWMYYGEGDVQTLLQYLEEAK